MEFRRDINGLRAWAVLAVVLYHFGLPWAPGGFAGVDVFFVISGFLMTGIILTKMEAGTFSFPAFCLARARRIVPALALLCAVLLAAGYFWLTAADYQMLGKHAAGAASFSSNFMFRDEEGYFDAPSRDKWLLHSWSLAVEWQFYLLYPLFLSALRGRLKNGGAAALLAAGLLSFALSAWKTGGSGAFAFYLLPARVWEFMAGAGVFLLLRRGKPGEKTARALEGAGFLLMLATFLLAGADVPWPGYAAAVPVLGAALVLLAAREKSWLTGSAPAQRLGDWSYSVYLWHWPVVVGLAYFGLAGGAFQAAGAVLSLALGAASHYLVETPFRKHAGAPTLLAAVLLLAGAGTAVSLTGGLPARVPQDVAAAERAGADSYAPVENCGFRKKTTSFDRCWLGATGDAGFALWGDSHSYVVAEALQRAAGRGGLIYNNACPTIFNVRVRTRGEDRPCEKFNAAVLKDIGTLPPEVPVVIVNRFSYYLHGFNEGLRRPVGLTYLDASVTTGQEEELFAESLAASLCRIAQDRKTYVLQPVAEMGADVPKTIARRLMAGAEAPEISVPMEEYARRHAVTLSALRTARDRCGVTLLDPLPLLCAADGCAGTKDGKILYFDDDHLSRTGAALLEPLFRGVFR